MAGGIGSRFWPMSTTDLPKQFIDVLGCGRTLIQMTVDRFKDICPAENTWILTQIKYKDVVKEQLPDIPDDHILLEPCRRSTAPCIAYASWKIKAKNPKANLVVTPEIYRVDGFKEKPNLETAERYLRRNNFFWNSGIFVWNVNTIVNAIRVYQPPMARIFERLLPIYYTDKEQEMINELFPTCENISIDYALMEKADEIYAFPASFGWSDLGTWSSLYRNMKRDAHSNVNIGPDIKTYETRNCIIHTTQEKRVVVQGLDGYIVAEHDDMLLVCRLTEEQRIKDFVGDAD